MAGLLLLGWSVGHGLTAIDRPFYRDDGDPAALRQRWLLIFTDWRMLGSVLLLCLVVALYRRWWSAAVAVVVCPAAGLLGVYLLKRLFGRMKDGLAYPSGHTTQVVIVMSLLVLIVSARLWVVAIAVIVSLLGMISMVAVGFHYLTDTFGGALLGTAIVCVAAQLAGRSAPQRNA
ncbi:MAG: hypothetical protein QOH57_2976 [Mycobacterium sp.]|jgi:membrane-associated phospholipid phosphatase|nr:hypothetical protein [Mycobacterium sp.]